MIPSKGREPYVFRAARPEELPGGHADLMASALSSTEQARYMLYSPMLNEQRSMFHEWSE